MEKTSLSRILKRYIVNRGRSPNLPNRYCSTAKLVSTAPTLDDDDRMQTYTVDINPSLGVFTSSEVGASLISLIMND